MHVPINSLAELNADMLNFDTNQSEPDQTNFNISKRLMYELKFEKYLKNKIRDEIERKSKVAQDKYVAPEERLRLQKQARIEQMVRERIEGKTLTPEEMERQRLEDQGTIDADEDAMQLLKQLFCETLEAQEREHSDMSDEDSYELQPAESVDKHAFVERVLKSEAAKPFIKLIAREPSGVSNIPAETFEQVLRRMQKNYLKQYITWDKLLNYFTRKGSAISDADLRKLIDSGAADEVDENEVAARNKAIKNEVNKRMAEYPMFPRNDGKGKYRITIPGDPAFMKRDKKKGKSIRERKLEEMIKYKYLEDEYEMSQQFRAKEIPKSTLEPRYEKLLKQQEERRRQNKENFLINKQAAKPFSFYDRDMMKFQQRYSNAVTPIYDPEYDVMNHPPFKANPVPGHAKIQMYDYMMKKDKKERELRIKQNAELALAQSKLPPRMALYERIKETNEIQKRSKSYENPEFTFKPAPSKPVPDFETLQLNFHKGLESKRQSKS